MALPEGHTPKAVWTDIETQELVDFLYEKRSEGDGGGNFKTPTYNAAAAHIASHLSQGPIKTGPMCKTKWTSIKSIYTAIETYRNQSGFHWDNIHGANIVGEAADNVWKTYIKGKSNACLRPFRNHGWPYYDKVQTIIPGNRARGAYAYRPATAQSAPPSTLTMEPDNLNPAAEGSNTSIAPLPPHSVSESSQPADDIDMDLDNAFRPSSFKTGSSKRSFEAMSSETGTEFQSQHTPLSAGPSNPASKKLKRSGPKASASGIGTLKPERPIKGVTQATAVVGMQGSINRLTDIFEKSMTAPLPPLPLLPSHLPPPPDQTLERKARALQLVQERDDELMITDKVTLISIFDGNPATIDTYLGLSDSEVRRAWISHLISKN